MVNGVNNNNINTYRNPPVRPSKADMDAPPFLLQYEEKGVVWERKDQDEKEKAKEAEERLKKAAAAEVKPAAAKTTSVSNTPTVTKDVFKAGEQAETSLLQEIFDKVKGFFTGIFRFIWYGDEGKAEQTQKTESGSGRTGEGSEKNEPGMTGSAVMESAVAAAKPDAGTTEAAASRTKDGQADRDARIRELIARHDTKGVVDILTENHTIQPARNSTLLTYYNRYGKIVEMNQTNTGRILHGDRHTRSL